MVVLFAGEFLEHASAARVGGHGRGSRVELETAPLGRNRDPQGVAREHQLGRRAVHGHRPRAGPALVADPKYLDDRLRRLEVTGDGDFLDERLDVRTEKLGRLMADVADEMEVSWMPVRGFESRSS